MVRLVFITANGLPWHWNCSVDDAAFVCSLVDDRLVHLHFSE